MPAIYFCVKPLKERLGRTGGRANGGWEFHGDFYLPRAYLSKPLCQEFFHGGCLTDEGTSFQASDFALVAA
jgi:hypothetical protein